jgi:predicted helicase
MGAVPLGNDAMPLSIKKLATIRQNQLSLWTQKKLPLNELIRRQQAIAAAGHFEAYNYWLFQSARPDEFNEWVSQHPTQFKNWLDWQNKNKFTLESADFQRLHVMRGW